MDLNGDGRADILSGSYSRMEKSMAGLFQVLWGQEDGKFSKAKSLAGTDGEPLIIPIIGREQMTENICTRPTAVDWDCDGNLDLVVGNFAGSFYWFKGEGKGEFDPKPEKITTGDSPLKIAGVHSDPFVVDWDSDGDLDLLSGSSNGGVQWSENTAGPKKTPVLKPFETLIEHGTDVPYGQPLAEDELKGPAKATRVWVDDVNGDGKLDILVGDNVTLVSPAKGLSDEEFKKQHEEWQKAFNDASTAMSTAGDDPKKRQEANQRFIEIYNQRSKFMTENRTGFVWLYVQK